MTNVIFFAVRCAASHTIFGSQTLGPQNPPPPQSSTAQWGYPFTREGGFKCADMQSLRRKMEPTMTRNGWGGQAFNWGEQESMQPSGWTPPPHGGESSSDLTPTPLLTFWALLGGGVPWGAQGATGLGSQVPQRTYLKMTPSLHWSF